MATCGFATLIIVMLIGACIKELVHIDLSSHANDGEARGTDGKGRGLEIYTLLLLLLSGLPSPPYPWLWLWSSSKIPK